MIRGTATTPNPDRMGDVVEPLGVTYAASLPLLLYHDSKQPVGTVTFDRPTKDGIDFEASLPTIDSPPSLKERVDTAWASVKAGLLKGASIGFRVIEEAYNKETQGFRYLKTEVLELSLVSVPANQDCTIAAVKALDLAASGRSHPSGASDPARVVRMRTDTKIMKKSFADQIVDWEATRAAKAARQEAIQQKALDEGRGKDEAEKEEFSTLDSEIKGIDDELVDLRKLEAREKAAAKSVAGRTPDDGARSRTGAITLTKTLPPGIQFARYAMCMGMARGNPFEARQLAQANYGDEAGALVKLIDLQQKTAIGAGNTQTSHAYDDLVPYNVMDDFIEYLRPRTILGKITGLRRVAFNTRTSGFSAGLSANWVGEGLPIPLSRATSMTITLGWAKLAALTVLTKEEIRFSNPAAESKIRDDIAKAIIAKQDIDFIDPGKAAVANVSPASITFNTTPIAPTNTTAAAFRTDFATLLATFATLLLDPSDIVIVMSTIDALNLSLMVNTLGVPSFPGLTMAGGTLLGFPVITSEAMVALGSPDERIIVAVKAGDIYLADDGVVTVDASDQASLEMFSDTSSQSGISGAGATQVSLWQTGMLGLKATREINWKLRRTGAARYLGPCLYAA